MSISTIDKKVTFRTEQLKRSYIQRTITQYSSGKRKITGSSNLLSFFGWEKGCAVTEVVIGKNKGIKIIKDSICFSKKIYERKYKRRSNNPAETYFEISNQSKIDEAFPEECETVNIKITDNCIYVTPCNRTSCRNESQNLVFDTVCSAGVDAHAFFSKGWTPNLLATYRPKEKRDNSDKSETQSLAAIANIPFKQIINQDLYKIDYSSVAECFDKPIDCLVGSLECHDYSSAKSKEDINSHIETGETTLDMWVAMLDNIKQYRYPPRTIMLENVVGFIYNKANNYKTSGSCLSYIKSSPNDYTNAYMLFELQLRRLGYKVTPFVSDVVNSGSPSRRFRAYIFATQLDSEFSFPYSQPHTKVDIWKDIIIPEIPNLKPMKSQASFSKEGRRKLANVITANTVGPIGTILRSQARQVSESVYIQEEKQNLKTGEINTILSMPNASIMKQLMTIPKSFNLGFLSSEEEHSIIGQSVCYKLYTQIAEAIKNHIYLSYKSTDCISQQSLCI